jgi:hypothetical protein
MRGFGLSQTWLLKIEVLSPQIGLCAKWFHHFGKLVKIQALFAIAEGFFGLIMHLYD